MVTPDRDVPLTFFSEPIVIPSSSELVCTLQIQNTNLTERRIVMREMKGIIIIVTLLFVMGAKGDGCVFSSNAPAPNISEQWSIEYEDNLQMEGATYWGEVSGSGCSFEFEHKGRLFSFDLDCARPEVLCPSEGWPTQIERVQRNSNFLRQESVHIPIHVCDGELRAPELSSCGTGTKNEGCKPVCDGDLRIIERERTTVIGNAGNTFQVYLGDGAVSSGVNCLLLATSLADAGLINEGSEKDGNWRTRMLETGLVSASYPAGCLALGVSGEDSEVVLGAQSTSFSGNSVTLLPGV